MGQNSHRSRALSLPGERDMAVRRDDRLLDRVLVVAHTTTLIPSPGDKADLLDRREIGTRPRRHVADLICALSGGVVEVFAKCLAGRIRERSYVLSENSGLTGRDDAVSDVEAEWIEVTVLEAALALVEHPECLGLIGLNSEDRLFEHDLGLGGRAELVLLFLLCECGDRGREGHGRDCAYHDGTKHRFSPCW